MFGLHKNTGSFGTHLRALVEILPNSDQRTVVDLLVFGLRSFFR